MRIRPAAAAFVATATATATAVVVAVPRAAAAAVAVPGTYRIVDAAGLCLHGDGGRNAKARLGACDTTWEVERRGEGFTIVHPATGHCLSMGLERIYPPFVSTLPCDDRGPSWLISDTGDGRVTISLGAGSALLTGRGIGRPARLLPAGKCQDDQRWILDPV